MIIPHAATVVRGDELNEIDQTFITAHLRVPGPRDHKYARGVPMLATGSPTYPGAAVLGVGGALSVGPGMVRFSGAARCEDLVISSFPEAVLGGGRFDAALIGSGWDSSMASYVEAVARECADAGRPLIVDAGALRGVREWAERNPLIVATPHAGEASEMFSQFGEERARVEVDADIEDAAVRLSYLANCVMVVKGATTCVATPDGASYCFRAPAAWGATAGAGDVLAGMICAMVSQVQAAAAREGAPLRGGDLAGPVACAVGLHGLGAATAAGVLTASLEVGRGLGHPIVASEIAGGVRNVFSHLLVKGR